MANIEEISGVYGGVKTEVEQQAGVVSGVYGSIKENAISVSEAASSNLPAKVGFWNKVKSVLFYEIKVELTPYQQKIENEINEFLHQEITWTSVKNFLFRDISFGKKKE